MPQSLHLDTNLSAPLHCRWDNRTSAVIPDEEIFYLVAFLSSAPSSSDHDNLDRALKQNDRILDFCKRAGIRMKQYLPYYTMQEEWRGHFGDRWEDFARRKGVYDPLYILVPGQRIFQKAVRSSWRWPRRSAPPPRSSSRTGRTATDSYSDTRPSSQLETKPSIMKTCTNVASATWHVMNHGFATRHQFLASSIDGKENILQIMYILSAKENIKFCCVMKSAY